MELDIRPLEPGLLGDYLDFFDNVAFADHPEWADCYCTYYHLDSEAEKSIEAETADGGFHDVMRDRASRMVRDGTMQGYLAYRDGRPVGWCNTADKGNYLKFREDKGIWEAGADERIKSVVCFVIAPGARRQGVATALLERAISDAAKEGYRFLEAYPANGELDCYKHYHGHPAMYRKAGFKLHRESQDHAIYRKELRENR